MLKSEIEIGGKYAFRARPNREGTLLEQVEVHAWMGSGVWKVRRLDPPNAGRLKECKSSNLIVPWDEREAFLLDEERLVRVLELSASQWDGGPDDPLIDAINLVFEAAGVGDACLRDSGGLAGHASMPLMKAKRILKRCDLEIQPADLHPLAFVDRHRNLHLPFQAAFDLAKALITAEPQSVLKHVAKVEKHWENLYREEEEDYMADLMEQWRTAWGLVREWVAVDRRQEIASTNQDQARDAIALLWQKFHDIEQRRALEHQELKAMLAEVLQTLTSETSTG